MKIKTSELTGRVLNHMVHVAMRYEPIHEGCTAPPYSTDWCFGGPILERECMELKVEDPKKWLALMWWDDENSAADIQMYGPTPLIAAMRCYVASKLGDEVDVPEELLP